MKKILSLFALLASITASATITVTPLSVDYSTKKVAFSVSWTDTPYNNCVWVWVDLCPITGSTAGTFTQAVISNPSATVGSITTVAGNTRGFYVTTNPSTVTATLSNATGKFNWCAYGSDYPPNVLANTDGSYTLAGTPPFTLIASNGTIMQTVNGTTIATAAVTMTPATITDATGYPGLWCPYTGSDLYMDDTHRCLQRQTGAYNWEAWIKDSKDNELYRIVKMPDDKWWLAQNIRYNKTGIVNSYNGCTDALCGRLYTGEQMSSTYTGSTGASGYGENKQGICPNNWALPVYETWRAFVDAIEISPSWGSYNNAGWVWVYGCGNTISQHLAAPANINVAGNNYYGWSSNPGSRYNTSGYEAWRCNRSQYCERGLQLTSTATTMPEECVVLALATANQDNPTAVRCFRQL